MRHQRKQAHHIDSLIALVLFGVFAACILSVLLTGAGVYHRLTVRDQDAWAHRTCAQYIATKLRQAPVGGAVSVEDFGGVDALALTEEISGSRYVTRVYCYDGWLRELFAAEGDEDFLPEHGEKVIEAEAMELTLEDGLLHVSLRDSEGQDIDLRLGLRGEGAAS